MTARWKSFDALKGLACIAVVLIHYPFASKNFVPQDVSISIKSAMRFAVPVFFGISGFFCIGLGDRLEDAGRVARKFRHVFGIFAGSAIFYQIFNVVRMPLMDPKWTFCGSWSAKFEAARLAKFFLTHDPLFYSHLWFLLALMMCYCVMLFVDRRWKLNVLLWLCPILAALMLLMQEFHVVRSWIGFTGVKSGLMLHNSFLFRALPFFLFGGIVSIHQEWIRRLRLPDVLLIVLALVGMASGVYERLHTRESQFYLGSYLTAVAMIVWAVRRPERGWPWLVYIGRNLSMYVYILHIAVVMSISVVGKYCHFWGSRWYDYTYPVAAILLSLVVSEAVYRIKSYLSDLFPARRDEIHNGHDFHCHSRL